MNQDTAPTLLLYSSHYGTARFYAEQLAAQRECDLAPASAVKLTQLRAYQTLIWIGGVYSETIAGLETLQRYYAKLMAASDAPRIAVLAVGAAPEEAAASLALPGALAGIPLFYARGRWNPQAMDFKDALMIKMLRAALARKPEVAPGWMRQLLESEEAQDFTADIYLDPVLDFISGR